MIQKVNIENEDAILQTIGITGVQKGVGVTHISIMLGNYIRSKHNKNVAILEMNQTGAFEELKEYYSNRHKNEQRFDTFSVAEVTYYNKVEKEMLGMIYNRCKDYVILDFGEIKEECIKEFLKCNIKIVVGNLNPWNRTKLVSYMEYFIARDFLGKIKYISRFITNDEIRHIKNIYKTNIYALPFEPDPFLIHGCNFEFLEKLL